LGRASLYHHFPKGKEEMAASALNLVNTWLEESILTPLRQESEPIERLRDLSKNLYEFYNCGQQTCLFTMFALGESKDLFQLKFRKP
jgi:AcrR family transcriptional regulator